MTTLYIPVGPPGCGKSYLAAEAVAFGLLPAEAVVCPDDYRLILTGDVSDQTANATAFEIVDLIVNTRLDRGLDAWIDATNLGGAIDRCLAMAAHHQAEARLIVFTDLLDVVLERNASRSRMVPEDVVRRMHASLSEVGRRHQQGWPANAHMITSDLFRYAYLDGNDAKA